MPDTNFLMCRAVRFSPERVVDSIQSQAGGNHSFAKPGLAGEEEISTVVELGEVLQFGNRLVYSTQLTVGILFISAYIENSSFDYWYSNKRKVKLRRSPKWIIS